MRHIQVRGRIGRVWMGMLLGMALMGCMGELTPGTADEEDLTGQAVERFLSKHGLEQSVKIINGQPAREPRHRPVVVMALKQNDGTSGICTGTLIAPDVILTAAHCFANLSGIGVAFTDGDQIAGTAKMVQSAVHPSYTTFLAGFDIALFKLDKQAPAGFSPASLLPSQQSLTDQDLGQAIEMIGWGKTGAGLQDQGAEKRFTSNKLGLLCQKHGGCDVAGWNSPGEPFPKDTLVVDERQNLTGICFGDSGGPAMVNRNGTYQVTGVVSYTSQACDLYSTYTNLDAYRSFIDEALKRFAGQNVNPPANPPVNPPVNPPTGGGACACVNGTCVGDCGGMSAVGSGTCACANGVCVGDCNNPNPGPVGGSGGCACANGVCVGNCSGQGSNPGGMGGCACANGVCVGNCP